jgi:hypothetical protein
MTTYRITTAGAKQTWSSRAERDAYRKDHRLCVTCGIDLEDVELRLCDDCKARAAKRQKKYRKKHPENRYAILKADRKANPEKHRKARLAAYEADKVGMKCTKCSQPAAEDSRDCPKHRDLGRQRSLNWWRNKGKAKREARRAA